MTLVFFFLLLFGGREGEMKEEQRVVGVLREREREQGRRTGETPG